MVIKIRIKVTAQCGIAGFQLRRIPDEFHGMAPDIVCRTHTGRPDGSGARRDKILNLTVDKATDDKLSVGSRTCRTEKSLGFPHGFGLGFIPKFKALESLFLEQSRGQSILQIMAVIGYLVGNVGNLSLQRWAGMFAQAWMNQSAIMLPEALKNLVGQIESRLLGVTLLECLDHAEALVVMVESAMIFHQTVQSFLAGMSERGVSEIVGQSDGLSQILVETEGAGHSTADRGDLYGVGQARAVMIPLAVQEDLRLSIKSAKGGAVHDPVPISLEAGSERVLLLVTNPSRGL
jgi:hypothetical protein